MHAWAGRFGALLLLSGCSGVASGDFALTARGDTDAAPAAPITNHATPRGDGDVDPPPADAAPAADEDATPQPTPDADSDAGAPDSADAGLVEVDSATPDIDAEPPPPPPPPPCTTRVSMTTACSAGGASTVNAIVDDGCGAYYNCLPLACGVRRPGPGTDAGPGVGPSDPWPCATPDGGAGFEFSCSQGNTFSPRCSPVHVGSGIVYCCAAAPDGGTGI